MSRSPSDVTEAELAVLEVLWSNGPSTVRQITEVLYPGGGPSKLATVQKLLERLERDNRFVKRDRSGGVQRFSAALDREHLIARRLDRIADSLCGGSHSPLLTQLVRSDRLSRDDLQSLRELIDELDTSRAGTTGVGQWGRLCSSPEPEIDHDHAGHCSLADAATGADSAARQRAGARFAHPDLGRRQTRRRTASAGATGR